MARTLGDTPRQRRALDRFLKANEPLAQLFAAKFLHGKRYDYEMCEVFGACMRGLYAAALAFDVQRGYAFSTYARNWMLKALLIYEHNVTNHISRPIEKSMGKGARTIEAHDEKDDPEFLSLRACRHWHLFAISLHGGKRTPFENSSEAPNHGHRAEARADAARELHDEDFDPDIDFDGPRVLRYLRDALGDRDFGILVSLYCEGLTEQAFAERNKIPLLHLRQVRETAFNHARAFVR